jgi:putative transposase
MSWVRIWVHMVFTTKDREPVFNSIELRKKVFSHIISNNAEKGIHTVSVGGYNNHLHCLLSLNKDLSISKVAQLIKGESSYWINQNKLIPQKFAWQDDYWAVGVSESHIESVKEYISNQEEHHKRKTFTEEVDEFMKKYGWKFVKEED